MPKGCQKLKPNFAAQLVESQLAARLFSAGSETRTRTTVKSQVFETSASTIPPFPHFGH